MSKQTGLPQTKRMRHDSHFVDELTAPQRTETIGKIIDIDRVKPNPNQPRKSFGDLSEMVASVKEKGILEPILVRTHEEGYEIIAGERRYQASKLAGLQRIPCIEVDVDHRGMLEISLIENLQRKDLTPFEEAAAIQRLCEQFRYTHEDVARKLGKSRTVVTEMLSLNRMPEDVQERCRQADITSKSMLLQIVRQPSEEAMHRLIDRIADEGLTREDARRVNRDPARPKRRGKNFTYRYRPDNSRFRFTMTFPEQPDVEPDDLILALREVLDNLVRERGADDAEQEGRSVRRPRTGRPIQPEA